MEDEGTRQKMDFNKRADRYRTRYMNGTDKKCRVQSGLELVHSARHDADVDVLKVTD